MRFDRKSKWEKLVVDPAQVMEKLDPGMSIFIGTGVGEPRTLVKRGEEKRGDCSTTGRGPGTHQRDGWRIAQILFSVRIVRYGMSVEQGSRLQYA